MTGETCGRSAGRGGGGARERSCEAAHALHGGSRVWPFSTGVTGFPGSVETNSGGVTSTGWLEVFWINWDYLAFILAVICL